MFVPIERTVTFDEARHICETVGRHVHARAPAEITMEWAVEKRTGKIFIDYNMNVRGKTLNVAYSPRGVAGSPGLDAADLGGTGGGRADGLYNQECTGALGKDRRPVA